MIHNRANVVILNNIEKHSLKDTIIKFGFGLKISEFCLYITKYRADLMRNLYRAFKKVETYFDILNARAKI